MVEADRSCAETPRIAKTTSAKSEAVSRNGSASDRQHKVGAEKKYENQPLPSRHRERLVESGWNRAEVLYALVQRGLFDLYEFASPETVEAIVQRVVQKVAPPQPPVMPEQ
jgi:hypothetical protein